jgi:hypothetical protein
VEVKGPVFFARQQCAPRRVTRSAVVQRAARRRASGVESRDHERLDRCQVSSRRRDAHGRLGIDAAVVGRVDFVLPLASAVFAHFHQRHAVVVDFLQRLQAIGGAGAQVPVTELGELLAVHAVAGLALRMHEMRVGRAFVVHRQHGTTGICRAVLAVAANVEKLHPIVVVAHTLAPVVSLHTHVS